MDESNNKIQKRTSPSKLAREQRGATSPIEKRPFPVYLLKSSPVVWKRTLVDDHVAGTAEGEGGREELAGLQPYHIFAWVNF